MNRSKREENGIVIHFVFYFILMIGLIGFTLSSIVPEIKTIESKKEATLDMYENIERIDKTGLTFDEFKKLNTSGLQNTVIKEILKSISNDFYVSNLVNKGTETYKQFLATKNEELNSVENKFIAKEKINKISEILPSYTDTTIDLGGNVLTDYKFINYVESIVESFNFSTVNSIGISKIKLLDDFAVGNATGEGLDSNIFYIPLKLSLVGDKKGVVEFLYFIENVGNIKVNDEDIFINDDYGFLSKNGIKKVLEGDKYTSDYNIFEHQIVDIERVEFGKYIDSSYLSRGDKDFKSFIIDTQGNDNFSININLMFYVKGQPAYKIEEFINSVIVKHKQTIILVNAELKNTTIKGITRVNLLKENELLKQLLKEIITIKKNIKFKDKLENLYKQSVKLDELISPIFNRLNKE